MQKYSFTKPIVIWLCITIIIACNDTKEYVLQTDTMKRVFISKQNSFYTQEIVHKKNGSKLSFKKNEAFIIHFQSGKELKASEFDLENVTQKEQDEITAYFKNNDNVKVKVSYQAKEKYLYKDISIQFSDGTIWDNERISEIFVEWLPLYGNHTEEPLIRKNITSHRKLDATGRYSGGLGLGQPLFIDNIFFAGLEYPAGKNVLQEKIITLTHFPGKIVSALKNRTLVSKRAVWGSDNNSVVSSFEEYLKQYSLQPKRMRHFIDAYHLRGRANIGVGINEFPSEEEIKSQLFNDPDLEKYLRTEKQARLYAKEIYRFTQQYNIPLDAFVIDGGWQNADTLFEIDRYFLPHGFTKISAESGFPLGLWNSLAGFRLNRRLLQHEKDYHICPPQKLSFDLSYPNYLNDIKARLSDLSKTNNIQYWKQDFNFLVCPIDTPQHSSDDSQSLEANTDALIHIISHERELNPNVFINQTTFIWPSPWWLWHVNSLPALSADFGYFKKNPFPYPRGWHTSFVDNTLYRYLQIDKIPFPSSRFMTHGIIQDQYVHLGGDTESLRSFADGVVAHFAPGLQLQELYVDTKLLTEKQADFLGSLFLWMDHYHEILSDYGRMFGGNPELGLAYGFNHFKENIQIVFLRNPSSYKQNIEIPIESNNNVLSFMQVYPYHRLIHKTLNKTQKFTYEIPPFSVQVFIISNFENNQLPFVEDSEFGWKKDKDNTLQWYKRDSFSVSAPVLSLQESKLSVDTSLSLQSELVVFYESKSSTGTITIDGKILDEKNIKINCGPCGKYGCPLVHIEPFVELISPILNKSIIEFEPSDLSAYESIWLKTNYTHELKPIKYNNNSEMVFFPNPYFENTENYILIYDKRKQKLIKPLYLTDNLQGFFQLDQISFHVPAANDLLLSFDIAEKTGGILQIPVFIDLEKKQMQMFGKDTLNDNKSTDGTIILSDINAAGDVTITLSDYQGEYDPNTGMITIAIQIGVEIPELETAIILDFVAITDEVELSHHEYKAAANGQIFGVDNSVILAGTVILPFDTPVLGNTPIAISLAGYIKENKN